MKNKYNKAIIIWNDSDDEDLRQKIKDNNEEENKIFDEHLSTIIICLHWV